MMDMIGLPWKMVVFVSGLIVGSFLNVCIYRMPLNKSIVFPSSHCPNCKKSLRWFDNIPVISYIFLFGRCGHCRGRISLIYPVVEILTGVLFLLLFTAFGPGAKFYIYSAFVSALIVATFIDIKINEIPDPVSIGGLVAGLAVSAAFPEIFDTSNRLAGFYNSILGAVAGAGAIYAMGLIGKAIFKKEAMGGGDVKLMAMIGSVIGYKLVLLTFFMAPLFGAVVGLVMKIREGSETIAYGPYLSLAAVISIFSGNSILSFLFNY